MPMHGLSGRLNRVPLGALPASLSTSLPEGGKKAVGSVMARYSTGRAGALQVPVRWPT